MIFPGSRRGVRPDVVDPDARLRRQIQQHFRLERIRVLELVDQEVVEHLLVRASDHRVVSQEVAQLQQQVQVIDRARPSLRGLVQRHDDGKEAHDATGEPALERRLHGVDIRRGRGLDRLPWPLPLPLPMTLGFEVATPSQSFFQSAQASRSPEKCSPMVYAGLCPNSRRRLVSSAAGSPSDQQRSNLQRPIA